ncbi:MAG: hypothetical protein JKP98_06090 [Rhodobacteraceae bacterium]|nr:hypothetical protein [Paracoccaceae bacterium]
MHASIRLADGSWLMASDDWPGRYTPPASTHVLVTPPDAETARRAFDRLAEGGSVKMALDKTFWTEGFGTLVDRWGTPWMIMVHSDG